MFFTTNEIGKNDLQYKMKCSINYSFLKSWYILDL